MSKRHSPVFTGEYGAHGYTIFRNSIDVYTAGNNPWDSAGPALDPRDVLSLETIAKYCEQTGREMAQEEGGTWGGMEHVELEKDPLYGGF